MKSSGVFDDNLSYFDVAGHNYRMVTIVDYDFAVIDVRHIWTHEEYNKKQSILKKEAKKHANDK
ncbi:type II toxin-antitoxin system HigB family toxin [Cysteiniphilum halobium]|uniref:type II toxin-antitoxin system HigB family toxin n=1 Tax=Cysteiniphilum halobium TaxID=2219059 RepID=UPI003F86D807